jgi:hypothetical protein
MKLLKKITFVVVLLLVAMQFYSPTKNISPGKHTEVFVRETNPSAQLKTLFETSCYDCHSNNTVYPWYNNIAPISYWIASHVDEGKEHLNFSTWDTYSMDKKTHLLDELEKEVQKAEMPLTEYTWIHADAKLSDREVRNIVTWVKQTQIIYQLGKRPN